MNIITEKLAIKGGKKAVPDGTIKKWPPIDDTDRQAVLDSLNGANHAFGPNCQAFEKEWAEWNGNKYAITTNSGTAALHMAIVASGCSTGDEVIVTAYSWSSSATCILQHSCIPVFVDIDFDSINIDPKKIEAAITPKTKAIIAVHLHGLPCDMDAIMAVAKKHNLKVIEDACQAHGAKYKGRKVGTIGHCGAFSFNQNKCLCTGEGGMFVTDDAEMLAAAQSLWSFGETRKPSESRDYHVYALGWMYRNNDLTAAFGRSQLKKLDGFLARQKENAQLLSELLQGTPGLILPTEISGAEHNWYNYTMRFDMEALAVRANDAGDFRYKIVKAMNAEGVQTGVWQSFILPAMTVFQAKNGFGHGHPWSSPHAQPVDYSLDQYKAAQKHCDTHTGMTMPLRAPNGEEAVRATAEGIRKVMENVSEL
ncbi:MAG TPA: DegT/DnrJ/EryC1/StrS family aminotransferase [Planctomycetota bacterium]|nr:DegT/DnrJ/EryC1/StrS family aminotransferase [Planctomycetota bacterium]